MIDCSKCPGQGICCGFFPFSEKFFEKYKDKMQVKPIKIFKQHGFIAAVTEDLRCVFQNPKTWRCAIYEDRPDICRLYGTKEGIQKKGLGIACPFFKPNGNEWSRAMQAKIYHLLEKGLRRIEKKASESN